MADVFISYNRESRDIAVRLANALRGLSLLTPLGEETINVWLDIYSLPPGVNWREERRKALENSNLLILLMSPAAIQSYNVAQEWGYFLFRDRPIIPVRLGSLPYDDIPVELRDIIYVDLPLDNQEDDGLVNLVDAIVHQLSQLRASTFQLVDHGALSVHTLKHEVTPYIEAIIELQAIIDHLYQRPPTEAHIHKISVESPLAVSLDIGIGEVIRVVADIIIPARRKRAREQLAQETIETELLRLELANKIVESLNIQLSPIERARILAKMVPSVRTLLESQLVLQLPPDLPATQVRQIQL